LTSARPAQDRPENRAPESRASTGRTQTRLRLYWKAALRSLGRAVLRSRLGPSIFRRWSSGWRYETLGEEHLAAARAGRRGVLLALWHGRMLLAIPPYLGQDVTILVSGSEDGDLSEGLLAGCGFAIVRGSSSSGGARALRALTEALRRGSMVVVTPDGPRGPRHAVNPGLAWMASRTGHAVLPAGYVCDAARALRTWDRYTLPRRGCRAVVAYGAPIEVPKDAGRAELERASTRIRDEILAAERAARARLGEAQGP